eukprot:TRINITY_DN32740_c0_g1_i1.p1 TRINITY_DN32740_c0_g1~~TRINITY_DN32740_c0_g1_i1.p1  ORF type:complete len:809 (-),score=51.89 TRINITY_DN32740_c0_g1_i1:173-2599(-)
MLSGLSLFVFWAWSSITLCSSSRPYSLENEVAENAGSKSDFFRQLLSWQSGLYPWAVALLVAGAALSLLLSILDFSTLSPKQKAMGSSVRGIGADEAAQARSTYTLTRFILWRYLGFVALLSFVKIAFSFSKLRGPHGLLPLSLSSETARAVPFFTLWERLFGVAVSENSILFGTSLGMFCSLLMLFSPCKSMLFPIVIYILQVSFVNSADYMHVDGVLLCEYFFIATVLYPSLYWRDNKEVLPAALADLPLWLFRFASFRLLLEAGISKVTRSSGDSCWADLTCTMFFHRNLFPNRATTNFVFANMPDAFLKMEVVGTHILELGVIWLVLCSHRSVRHCAAAMHILLQLTINSIDPSFFGNFIPIAGFIACFDDDLITYLSCKCRGDDIRKGTTTVSGYVLQDSSAISTSHSVSRKLRDLLSWSYLFAVVIVAIIYIGSGLGSLDIMLHGSFDGYESANSYHEGAAQWPLYNTMPRQLLVTQVSMRHDDSDEWIPLELPLEGSFAPIWPFALDIFGPGVDGALGTLKYDADMYMSNVELGKTFQMPLRHVYSRVLQGDSRIASLFATPLDTIFREGKPPAVLRAQLVKPIVCTWTEWWETGCFSKQVPMDVPSAELRYADVLPKEQPVSPLVPLHEWLCLLALWQTFDSLSRCARWGYSTQKLFVTVLLLLLHVQTLSRNFRCRTGHIMQITFSVSLFIYAVFEHANSQVSQAGKDDSACAFAQHGILAMLGASLLCSLSRASYFYAFAFSLTASCVEAVTLFVSVVSSMADVRSIMWLRVHSSIGAMMWGAIAVSALQASQVGSAA